jgi:opacity protein-like surface antigen
MKIGIGALLAASVMMGAAHAQIYNTAQVAGPDVTNAQEPARGATLKRGAGSVYSSFKNSISIRPGYAFAGDLFDLGTSGEAGLTAGASFRRTPRGRDANGWYYEAEVLYLRDEELEPGLVDATAWSLTGLASVGYQYDFGPARQYLSFGVGPHYSDGSVTTTVLGTPVTADADGDINLGYSLRAGFAGDLTKRLTFEAGYRYLGATDFDDTVSYHIGEVGFTYSY